MWFTTSSGRIEFQLTKKQAAIGSHQGQCDQDIEYLLTIPAIKRQIDKLDPALIARELSEYGAWDDEELKDSEQNKRRLLWIACGDIVENK